METTTKADALKSLDRIALDAESENYHSTASIIWREVIPLVKTSTERTLVIIPLEYSGVETFLVVPD